MSVNDTVCGLLVLPELVEAAVVLPISALLRNTRNTTLAGVVESVLKFQVRVMVVGEVDEAAKLTGVGSVLVPVVLVAVLPPVEEAMGVIDTVYVCTDIFPAGSDAVKAYENAELLAVVDAGGVSV